MRHTNSQRTWLSGLVLGLAVVALLGTTVHLPTGGGGGTGLADIVEDTNPILGGNLDGDLHDITNLDDITMDDLAADAITATTVAATGQVSGSVCAAAGGAEEDNSLEVTLIDPGPPNPASAGSRRFTPLVVATVENWYDVDRTAAPSTIVRPVILGQASTDGTRGTTGVVYCKTSVDTTLDSGTEMCTSVSASLACVGLAFTTGSAAASPATVNTFACGTDSGGTGNQLCAPCQ